MIRILIYDRRDNPLRELSEDEVFELTRHERVNGEHSLTVTTTAVLEQGWRVLTRDARGKWREHVVYGTDEAHAAGERPFGTYYCVWSLQHDLLGTRVSSMPGVQNPVSASVALDHALAGTSRWQRGTVTNSNTGGASMYDMDGWSAMSVLVANWGGEVDATIEVGSDGVVARKADLYSEQGEQAAKRRYDFGADVRSVRRKLADGPLYCRITPRGKGEETDSGFYGRRVTIAPVNQGRGYLENPAMVELAKLPDGNGGWEYPTLEVENSDCETPQQLKDWAQPLLEEYTQPKVTYEVDVMQVAREGVDMHGVSLGDAVQVVDGKLGVRVSARVLEMTQNLLDEWDCQIVLGNVEEGLSGLLGGIESRLAQVSQTVAAINGGGFTTADYLSRLLDRINGEINATGGYTYIVQGEGVRTYDVAVSDPSVGAEAHSVVEIKGGTIRIANTRTAQGEWEWKTVFTSGHIAGELVTAAEITTGYIGSAGDTFIDLDNNTVQLGQSTANHLVITDQGTQIFNSAGSQVSFFGIGSDSRPYVKIGGDEAWDGNIIIKTAENTNDGMEFVLRWGDTPLASMNYGRVHKYGVSDNWRGRYFTFGVRGEDGSYYPGDYSTAIGYNNVARGEKSFAGGSNCKATGDTSFAFGSSSEATAGYVIGNHLRSNGAFTCGTYNYYGSAPVGSYAELTVGGGDSGGRSNAMVVYDDGDTVISGTLTQSSDRRLKDHVAYLSDDAVEFVRGLKPALFSMKSNGKRRLGFYAQDVRDSEPTAWDTETVTEKGMSEEMPDMLTLDYTALIAPIVAYVQSLEKRIEALEAANGQ